jgi:hypothetical protein
MRRPADDGALMFKAVRERWRESREAWQGLRAFQALPRGERRIVFYAETSADWAHLAPIANALEHRGERVLRITSDRRDPALDRADTFFIGFGSARTVFFSTIEADAFVMTLSDLDRYGLRRSAHRVHYFYVFHSIASTHRVYREHAFDAYDTIFCVGPHHLAEIRATEREYGLPPKRLIEHGYGRLDTIISDLGRRRPQDRAANAPTVVVAPSWGDSSMVKHCLHPVLDVLTIAGFDISLRLHPMTRRYHPELADTLVARYGPSGRFHFDAHIDTTDALLAADIMISEWSGAPLEYAFARERPVVFIDTPPKTHNANFARIGLPCLEDDIRTEIGRLVTPRDVQSLPDVIRALIADAGSWRERIRESRDRAVFNIGRSGDVAAQVILDTLPPMRRKDV